MDTPDTAASLTAILADLNQAAEALWARCAPVCPGLSLDVRPEVGSTNTALMDLGRRGETGPLLMVAARQSAGRGRRGRDWLATPGDTLTFSLGLPLDLEAVPGGGSALSLAVGLALAEALDAGLAARHAQGVGPALPPIGLKWPNDLWLGTRKLGGILIEATPAPHLPATQRWVVIGVGLNVRPGPAASGAAWLEARPEQALSLGTVWQWLVPPLLDAVARFAQHGFAPLQAAYAARDVLQGQGVALWTTPGHAPAQGDAADQTGQAMGVDEHGALLVHTDQGPRRWHTGEVSVRPTA